VRVIYTAEAIARGGRTGTAETSDGEGELKLNLVKPKSMGGPGAGGTNPEQLFAAGYAACFISTMDFLAKQKKLSIGTPEIRCAVDIGPRDEAPGYGLAVRMVVAIPGIEKADAEALLELTHQTCPYSNAIRNNVDVTLSLAD
jgi:lipoyl-dependent peroxiredoxin